MRKPIVVVDLFCGMGGFTQGAIDAGAEVILSVDAWDEACEVHRANHIKVVVSSHDFEAINAVKDQFDGLFSPVKKVELLEDKNMSVGGCLLETELGNVDATIDSQMALLWLEINNDK